MLTSYSAVPIPYIVFYLTGITIQLVIYHKETPGSLPVMQKLSFVLFPNDEVFHLLQLHYKVHCHLISKFISVCIYSTDILVIGSAQYTFVK